MANDVLDHQADNTNKIPIRLHEAISLALKHSVSVHSAYLSRISDKFGFIVAKNQYDFQYSLSGSSNYNADFDKINHNHSEVNNTNIAASISLQNPFGGQLSASVQYAGLFPETEDNAYSSGINLSYVQPLLRGGGYTVGRAALTQSEFSERNSVLSLKSSLINLVGQVISTYRNYALALRSLKIAKISLQRSKQQVAINQALIAAGRLAPVELIQSETDLANQKLSLRSSENQMDATRVALLRLLRLKSAVQLDPIEPLVIKPVVLKLETVLKTALNNRPDYLQSLIAVEATRLNHKVARNQQRWDLNLTSTYALNGSAVRPANALEEVIKLDQGDIFIGLNLNIPLHDLQRKQSMVNARVQLIQTRNQLIDLKETIRLSLVNALRNIDILWDQVHLSKRSLELTRQQLELEQEKLRTGRSSNFQVVSFQNQLASAENQYVSSQIDYLNALTDLDQQLGITLEHWGIKIEPNTGLDIDNIEDYELGESSDYVRNKIID